MLLAYPLNIEQEFKRLAGYAVTSKESKGRKYPEEEDPFRTPFQRDRDRIIHAKAFRRLKGKTQVFVNHHGDHFRSRLSHSMEVAQLARDIARGMNLNEDLTESIALAHDLGHTPFGHSGEEAMNEIMVKFGTHFEHNVQSLRVVEVLEKEYPDFPGLNLSYETREGLKKHVPASKREFSLEGQVVDKADAIAYHNHDIDDGLRSHIISLKQLSELKIWKEAVADVDPALSDDTYRSTAIRNLISIMVNDLYYESEKRVEQANIKTLNDVYACHKELVGFSPELQEQLDHLGDFLGKNFYLSESIYSRALKGQRTIRDLFKIFSEKENLLPLQIRQLMESEERHIVIKDYIAGMTDEFAVKTLEELT